MHVINLSYILNETLLILFIIQCIYYSKMKTINFKFNFVHQPISQWLH